MAQSVGVDFSLQYSYLRFRQFEAIIFEVWLRIPERPPSNSEGYVAGW